MARDFGRLKPDEFREQLSDLEQKGFTDSIDYNFRTEALDIVFQHVKSTYCGRLQRMWPQTIKGKAALADKLQSVQQQMRKVENENLTLKDSKLGEELQPVIDRLIVY